MRRKGIIVIVLFMWVFTLHAQGDYFVKTTSSNASTDSPEETFLAENFPYMRPCDWTEGMKFMVIPDKQDLIISSFYSYATKKSINSANIKHQIFEFVGVEEDDTRGMIRFIFDGKDDRYYSEVRAKSLESLCSSKPKFEVKTLAYLGDVDKARELLPGMRLFTKTTLVRIDDPNGIDGYREVKLPMDTRVTVTNVGVSSNKAFPVKVIFEDEKGKSYFLEVAMSKTNSGMDLLDFSRYNKDKYFANAFGFVDVFSKALEKTASGYVNKEVYPIVNLKVNSGTNSNGPKVNLPRYTSLTITDMKAGNSKTSNILYFRDDKGNTYNCEVTLVSTTVTREENLYDDWFVDGNIKRQYPNITEANWLIIAQGKIKPGMTKDECKLSIGEPGFIKGQRNNTEEWIYSDRVVIFENDTLKKTTKQ